MTTTPTTGSNAVTEVPAAPAAQALAHYEALLALETDCWDVHEALASGDPGFVLLDVRGDAAWTGGHVDGATHLPRRTIDAAALAGYAPDALFVVYCACHQPVVTAEAWRAGASDVDADDVSR